MLRNIKSISLLGAATLLVSVASAFTPLGNWDTWQDSRKHYRNITSRAIGGGLNIHEEFRWNIPRLYYAFDNTFLSYFGQRGVEEVEKAIAILNALPRMSQANLDGFPLDTRRLNTRAQALAILDLKSVTLSRLLEMMGVAESPRFVFTLRVVIDTPAPCTEFYVIRRNFDVFGRPTSFINESLWTYRSIPCSGTDAYTANQPVDPLSQGEPVSNTLGLFSRFGTGHYYSGLTRDDIVGLRHIYRPENINYESLHPNISGRAAGPWGIPGGTSTNVVPNALRRGIDKVTFVRTDFDSLMGEVYVPITDTWTEGYVTNGVAAEQQLVRNVVVPDIVFSGQDFDTGAVLSRGVNWTPSPVINGLATAGPGIIASGPCQMVVLRDQTLSPGLIEYPAPYPGVVFNTTGPLSWHRAGAFLAEIDAIPIFAWGSFDGTTNVVVYPYGSSVDAIEREILGSTPPLTGGPWTMPPVQFNVQAGGGGGGGVTTP